MSRKVIDVTLSMPAPPAGPVPARITFRTSRGCSCAILRNETSEREAKEVNLFQTQRSYESDGVPRHRRDRVRSRALRRADPSVVVEACSYCSPWPLEIFLIDWWPIRADARLFDRLSAMPVRIVYTAAASSDAWRSDWPARPAAEVWSATQAPLRPVWGRSMPRDKGEPHSRVTRLTYSDRARGSA
jgi:hypothetical protein